jgi:ABC-type nitrate/sulfonate/bicarbonate transport system permease component
MNPKSSRSKPRRSLEHRPILRNVLMYVLSLLILIFIWTVASLIIEHVRDRAYLPNPIRAVSEVVRLGPMLFSHFWISAWRLLIAIVLAFAVGYPLGLLIGHERKLDQLISPMIYLVYPIPQVAFVLLLFIVFGIGEPVKIAIVAIALFFQLLVSARGAAKLIDREHIISVLSAGGSRGQIYRHVVIPATLPSILTSLRVSVGLGMAFLYIAETSGPARGGLGVFVKETMVYSPPPAFAGILAMAVLGSCFYVVIEIIERLVCRWKYVGRNLLVVAVERTVRRWLKRDDKMS